jgi:Protein of unknown function (DUF2695).
MSVGGVTVVGMNLLFGDPDPSDSFDLHEDDELRWSSPALGLTPAQQAALAAAVDTGLRRNGCDNTLRAAQQWAADAGVNWPRLRSRLRGNGGYCDCEIVFNVLPSEDDEPD